MPPSVHVVMFSWSPAAPRTPLPRARRSLARREFLQETDASVDDALGQGLPELLVSPPCTIVNGPAFAGRGLRRHWPSGQPARSWKALLHPRRRRRTWSARGKTARENRRSDQGIEDFLGNARTPNRDMHSGLTVIINQCRLPLRPSRHPCSAPSIHP